MSHRTIQDEQARLRKKRQKAESFFAIFKKPLHESLTSVLPVMLIVLVLCFTIRKPVHIFGKEFVFPIPRIAVAQMVVAGVDLIAAAACM